MSVKGRMSKYQWFCLLFPISQYIEIQRIVCYYDFQIKDIPEIVIWGIILGILADVYMILLFFRTSKREKMEKELLRMTYEYEIERLKFEQLDGMQNEIAKMKHDLQNHMIVVKNLV